MVQRGTYQPAPGLDDRAEAEALRAFEYGSQGFCAPIC